VIISEFWPFCHLGTLFRAGLSCFNKGVKIFVKAKPGAKVPRIERIDDGLFSEKNEARFVVAVQEPALDGRANRAIQKALAAYFKIPASRVRIVGGHTSRNKVFLMV
jgi:uncharacterized protein YggU (UPF0235/DUF167 family)